MKAEKGSADELVFSNSSEEKEKYFAALVVAAFLVVVILAPIYFGEELSWFGYIAFIVLSIGTSLDCIFHFSQIPDVFFTRFRKRL
jgi:hypothetical protein